MNRRGLLYGGAAALAGIAGAGAAWWKVEPKNSESAETAKISESFWAMSFDTPEGSPMAINSFRGKLLLVNFWATWCPPCVEELPLLDLFYRENKHKNIQMVGLAVDQPSAVRAWLKTRPLNFPVGMAGLAGTDLSKALGNTSGGLPFSAVFAPSGELRHRKIGKVLPEDLARWTRLS